MKLKIKEKRYIRIGNQTSYIVKTPILPFEYAVANGFSAFEWFPDKKENGAGFETNEINNETRHYIRDIARAHDVTLSIHAPLCADPMKPKGQELLMKDLHFAYDLGATLFNIHLYPDEGIEVYMKAITKITQKTAEMGISLSIENTPYTIPEDFNQLFSLLRNLKGQKTENVGMCLDLGHANLCNSTHNDFLSFMDRLDKKMPIIHVHLHENYGDRDTHMPIFTGPSKKNDIGLKGFIKRLKERNFSGSIILEQWPDPPLLLNQARDKLQRLFEAEGFVFNQTIPNLSD